MGFAKLILSLMLSDATATKVIKAKTVVKKMAEGHPVGKTAVATADAVEASSLISFSSDPVVSRPIYCDAV